MRPFPGRLAVCVLTAVAVAAPTALTTSDGAAWRAHRVPAAAQAQAAAATPSVTEPAVDVLRLAGADRYATGVAISGQYAPGVPLVYIATGITFPDALAAGAAAGTTNPVLLVAGGVVPDAVAAEVARLQPGKVVLVGGPTTVPDSVGQSLGVYATGGWMRLFGSDRYDTAAKVSAATFAPGVPVAYLAAGTNFPDALSGAALGAVQGAPVLLTDPGQLPAVTATELARLAPRRLVVLGSTASVGAGPYAAASALVPTITRVAGSDRYATNVMANTNAELPFGGPLLITTGGNFPDALAGSALAGKLGGTLLLVGPGPISAEAQQLLSQAAPSRVLVLGSVASVTATAISSVVAATATTPASTDLDAADYGTYLVSGKPMRWNPCTVIGWRANVTDAPGQAVLTTIKTAIDTMAQFSGLQLRYDGTTTFVPQHGNAASSPDDLVIAVVQRNKSDLLTANPSAVGVGGWASSGLPAWRIRLGYVVLDAAAVASTSASMGAGFTLGTLALHEIGHAVGLQHASRQAQIMFPVLGPWTPATYSAGDRAGLAAVGAGAGCLG